jgi:hypothetical protein
MKGLFQYLRGLTAAESEDSSKRFLAIYIIVILVTVLVFMYTDKTNVEFIIGELIFASLTLVGVAGWQHRNKMKYNSTEKEETKPYNKTLELVSDQIVSYVCLNEFSV